MAESDLLRPLRVVVVDDEPLARARLRTLLGEMLAPPAQVVAELGHAAAAQAWLAGGGVADVLLLDIHMPGIDGLQLAARLREAGAAPALVFVTAHADHALQAFDVEAVDYLTKPVRAARLQQALARAAQWLGRRAPPTLRAEDEEVIVVQQRGDVLRVPLREVLYLKAVQKYVELRTPTARHLLPDSLVDLAERLGDRLVRVHRNALVARSAVSLLARHAADAPEEDAAEAGTEQWAVLVSPVNEWLAVSRRQLPAVRDLLAATGR